MGARTLTSVWLCTAIVAGSGCATIVNGRTQAVTVSSEPPGARVFIQNQFVGVTPARLELPRRDAHLVVRLEKDGFASHEAALKRSVSAWLIGNVGLAGNPASCQGLGSAGSCPALLMGNVGVFTLIDWATGAAFKHPGVVRVILSPIGVGAELARPVR